MHYQIVNFYEFLDTSEDLNQIQKTIEGICKDNDILGTVLLAPEGANFGLSGSTENLQKAVSEIREQTPYGKFHEKFSSGSQKPYPKLKVKKQDSTITFLGDEDPKPEEILAGKRLEPNKWREYLNNPDVIVVDTRNEYEVEWGKFKGANSLAIDKFSEFPKKFLDKYSEQKEKTYIMYCTGGIRCEKAVAWAHKEGFENAYQLDGGIIGYFDQEGEQDYEGSCFVFDRRWAIDPEGHEVHTPPTDNVRQPKQYFIAESFAKELQD